MLMRMLELFWPSKKRPRVHIPQRRHDGSGMKFEVDGVISSLQRV
jgi:hypothetical protein